MILRFAGDRPGNDPSWQMTITYSSLGLSASGAALIARDQPVHARGPTERRHSWLKYLVYLVYLGTMISDRW